MRQLHPCYQRAEEQIGKVRPNRVVAQDLKEGVRVYRLKDVHVFLYEIVKDALHYLEIPLRVAGAHLANGRVRASDKVKQILPVNFVDTHVHCASDFTDSTQYLPCLEHFFQALFVPVLYSSEQLVLPQHVHAIVVAHLLEDLVLHILQHRAKICYFAYSGLRHDSSKFLLERIDIISNDAFAQHNALKRLVVYL